MGMAHPLDGITAISLCCHKEGIVSILLFLAASVAAHELIYAACGINKLALTSVEGVRGAGDFEFYHGIGLAFKLNGVVGLAGGAGKEHIAITHVLEDNGTVVLGVNAFFHGCALCIFLGWSEVDCTRRLMSD